MTQKNTPILSDAERRKQYLRTLDGYERDKVWSESELERKIEESTSIIFTSLPDRPMSFRPSSE